MDETLHIWRAVSLLPVPDARRKQEASRPRKKQAVPLPAHTHTLQGPTCHRRASSSSSSSPPAPSISASSSSSSSWPRGAAATTVGALDASPLLWPPLPLWPAAAAAAAATPSSSSSSSPRPSQRPPLPPRPPRSGSPSLSPAPPLLRRRRSSGGGWSSKSSCRPPFTSLSRSTRRSLRACCVQDMAHFEDCHQTHGGPIRMGGGGATRVETDGSAAARPHA